MFNTTGCSKVTELFSSQDNAYYDSPKFWEATTPDPKQKGLYKLENPFFENKPYNNLANFGNNILLIGEARYDSIKSDLPLYSFDIYDPWENEISQSLDAKDLLCTKYEISDDHLLCFSGKNKTLSIYDKELSLVYRLKIKDLIGKEDYKSFTYSFNSSNEKLFALKKDGTLYTITLSDKIHHNKLFKFFEKNDSYSNASYKKTDSKYRDCYIIGDNEAKNKFFVRGVNTNSYRYSYGIFNTAKNALTNTYSGTAYYRGDSCNEHIIVQVDYNRNYWKFIDTKDNTSKYFYAKNCVKAKPYGNNNLMLRRDIGYDQAVKRQNITSVFTAYSSSGKAISSIKLDFGNAEKGKENYLSKDQIYLEKSGCCFILKYDLKGNPFIYIWKINASSLKQNNNSDTSNSVSSDSNSSDDNSNSDYTIEDLSFFDNLLDLQNSKSNETGVIINNLKDNNTYKWDSLSEARKFADKIENDYGIKVFIGPQVPKKIDVFSVKQNLDADEIMESLESLNKILSSYPKDFFKQLCFSDIYGIRIYIANSIGSKHDNTIADPSGFVNTIDSYLVMVLDSSYSWDWPYTVNHEFSHMIDRKLEFEHSYNPSLTYNEEEWNKYNPAGFEYLQTYNNYSKSKGYSKNPKYFIDSYGTTFATEDRAEIFGSAMAYHLNGSNKQYFAQNSPIRAKMEYYCQCIRQGFPSSNWDKVMPWERCLNE